MQNFVKRTQNQKQIVNVSDTGFSIKNTVLKILFKLKQVIEFIDAMIRTRDHTKYDSTSFIINYSYQRLLLILIKLILYVIPPKKIKNYNSISYYYIPFL